MSSREQGKKASKKYRTFLWSSPCPRCSKATTLIWSHKQDRKFLPACHRCIESVDGYTHHDDKIYNLHFSPDIVLVNGIFQIEEKIDLKFSDIREFLDFCFDADTAPDPVKNHLTTDVWTLIALYSLLKKQSETEFHEKVCTRIFTNLKQVISGTKPLVSKRLSWAFLPPGKTGLERVIDHFHRLKTFRSDVCIDENRLRFISLFKPDQVYLGRDSFDGYVAFYFAQPKTAALECAFYGNALYILTQNWEALSRLSRQDLISSFQDSAFRVIHDSSYEETVKQHFRKLGIINT